jgi:hypothetical protein
VQERIVSPEEGGTAAELLALARLDYEAGRCELAEARLRRVLAAETKGESAAEALYYEALCEEALGRHESSARTFSALYASKPRSRFARDAAVRASRLWGYLDRWSAAGDAARFASERFASELVPNDQVAVYSARALAALYQGASDEAEYWTGKARVIVEANSLDSGGLIARDLAQMYFALGELRKLRSEAIVFDPVPPDFPRAFEDRAQLLLDAQGAYADVMRAEDAQWSARAGTRIGEMYENLHQAVTTMPPPGAVEKQRLGPLFEGAMRLRYSILLEKGLAMLDHTVTMVDRTDGHTRWAERARAARDRLAARLASENHAIDALPYTRESLREVLAELQRRKAGSPPTDGAPP